MLPVSFGNACCGYPSSEGISEEGSSVDSSNTPHQAIRDGEGVQPLHLHEAFAKADGPLECHAYLGGIHARYRKFLKHPGLAGLISDCETNGCTAVRISGSALKVGETNADYDVKTTIPCGGKPHVRGEIRVVTSQFTNCRYKAQDHLPIDVTFYRKESLAHSRIFKFEIYLYVECSSLIAGKTSIKPDKWVDPQSPIRLQVSAYDEQAQCFCFKDITRQELMGVLKLLYYDITPFYPSDRLPSLTWAWKYLVKAHQREPRFDPKNPLCAYVLQVQLPYYIRTCILPFITKAPDSIMSAFFRAVPKELRPQVLQLCLSHGGNEKLFLLQQQVQFLENAYKKLSIRYLEQLEGEWKLFYSLHTQRLRALGTPTMLQLHECSERQCVAHAIQKLQKSILIQAAPWHHMLITECRRRDKLVAYESRVLTTLFWSMQSDLLKYEDRERERIAIKAVQENERLSHVWADFKERSKIAIFATKEYMAVPFRSLKLVQESRRCRIGREEVSQRTELQKAHREYVMAHNVPYRVLEEEEVKKRSQLTEIMSNILRQMQAERFKGVAKQLRASVGQVALLKCHLDPSIPLEDIHQKALERWLNKTDQEYTQFVQWAKNYPGVDRLCQRLFDIERLQGLGLADLPSRRRAWMYRLMVYVQRGYNDPSLNALEPLPAVYRELMYGVSKQSIEGKFRYIEDLESDERFVMRYMRAALPLLQEARWLVVANDCRKIALSAVFEQHSEVLSRFEALRSCILASQIPNYHLLITSFPNPFSQEDVTRIEQAQSELEHIVRLVREDLRPSPLLTLCEWTKEQICQCLTIEEQNIFKRYIRYHWEQLTIDIPPLVCNVLEKTLRLFCGNESLAERKEVWPIPEEQDVSFIQSYVERLIEKIRQIAPLQRTISQEYSYVVKLANLPQLTDNETLIDWCRTQYLQLHASFLQWRTPYVELMTAVPKRGSMPYLGILTNNQKRFTATCHALLVAATDQLLCALITEGEDHRHCVDQWYSTDLPQFVLSQCQPEYINHSELQRFLSQCTFTKIRHVMQITVTCQAHCKQAIQDHKITPQQARKYRRYLTQNAIDASMDFWFHNFWEPRPWTEELANGFCRYVYEYLDQKDRTVSENRQQFLADFQMRLEGHVKKMQEKPKKKR